MANPKPTTDLFALPSLCVGLCLIGVCVLVPQSESNRRLAVERDQLRQDVEHVDAQLAVNSNFLAHGAADPEVAERLSQRQMRRIRGGTAALELDGQPRSASAVMTAADMLRVPSPPPVLAYRPPAGVVGDLTRTTHRQLLGLTGGLFLVGVGLLLGTGDGSPLAERY